MLTLFRPYQTNVSDSSVMARLVMLTLPIIVQANGVQPFFVRVA
jgi:hypothetical protein